MIDTIALKTSIIDLAVSGKLSSRFQASDSVSDILAALSEVSSKRKKLLEQAAALFFLRRLVGYYPKL